MRGSCLTVIFSACREKWLSQKEAKELCTSLFWLIHCYLLTYMKGFYLGWRIFSVPCFNSENCVNKSAGKWIHELTLVDLAVNGCSSERCLQCWWLAPNACIVLVSKLNIFKSQYFFVLEVQYYWQEHFLKSYGRAKPRDVKTDQSLIEKDININLKTLKNPSVKWQKREKWTLSSFSRILVPE